MGVTGEAPTTCRASPGPGTGHKPAPESSLTGLGNSFRRFCSSFWFVRAARSASTAPSDPLSTHGKRECGQHSYSPMVMLFPALTTTCLGLVGLPAALFTS